MTKLTVAVLALISIVASGREVSADETGLAAIHAWVKMGRKTCFADHYHFGSGTGATQRMARVEAVKSWTWPTSLEYGSSWADYRLAVGKAVTCTRSGQLWNCDTQARPCRAY
jgi:hypothetical protein